MGLETAADRTQIQPVDVCDKLGALPSVLDRFREVVAAGLDNGIQTGGALTIRAPLPGEFVLGGSNQVIVQRGEDFLVIAPPSGENKTALVSLYNQDPKSKCRLEVHIGRGGDRIHGFRLSSNPADWLILGTSRDGFESSLKYTRERGVMHLELSTVESMLQDATKILEG